MCLCFCRSVLEARERVWQTCLCCVQSVPGFWVAGRCLRVFIVSCYTSTRTSTGSLSSRIHPFPMRTIHTHWRHCTHTRPSTDRAYTFLIYSHIHICIELSFGSERVKSHSVCCLRTCNCYKKLYTLANGAEKVTAHSWPKKIVWSVRYFVKKFNVSILALDILCFVCLQKLHSLYWTKKFFSSISKVNVLLDFLSVIHFSGQDTGVLVHFRVTMPISTSNSQQLWFLQEAAHFSLN